MATPTKTTTTTTTTRKARCITCSKERSAVRCEGCLQIYCYYHLQDHRQQLNKQLDEIETTRDIFRQTLTQQTTDTKQNALMKQIDQWEEKSIRIIQQIADKTREILLPYITEKINQIENSLNKLTENIRELRQEEDFNEIDLNECDEKLSELTQQLNQSLKMSIQDNSTSSVNKISIIISMEDKQSSEHLQNEQENKNNEDVQDEIKLLQNDMTEEDFEREAYLALKTAFHGIGKDPVKDHQHQIEVQQQIATYQTTINDLQRENKNLIGRLSSMVEEYKILSRQHSSLERQIQLNQNVEKEYMKTSSLPPENTNYDKQFTSIIRITDEDELKQETQMTSSTESFIVDTDDEIRECLMCHWEFPEHMTLDGRRSHIEGHFT